MKNTKSLLGTLLALISIQVLFSMESGTAEYSHLWLRLSLKISLRLAKQGYQRPNFWRPCIWLIMRCWALMPPPEPMDLNILRIWAYWRRRLLTSWTVVPEPLAMRLRRLPLMISWSRRSFCVIELMMDSTRVNWPSSTFSTACCMPAKGPTEGSILRIDFMLPIFLI